MKTAMVMLATTIDSTNEPAVIFLGTGIKIVS